MQIHDLLNKAYHQFLQCLPETRVVLLHPDSKYRSMLLAKLMTHNQIKTYYYALGHDDITLQAFINGITHDLANQHPTFGRHLNMLPLHIQEDYSQHLNIVLETFSQELAELSEDTFVLILDEYDHCDSTDDIQHFTHLLADTLPPQCKIVINTRTLPRLPWVSMIAKRQAIMLKDEMIITEDLYSIKKHHGDCDLEVYALGPGSVIAKGEYIDSWEGHLPRLLLFFALDRPVITRSEICRSFWPELDDDQAVNVFHVTKRRLHKAIGFDVLVHDGSYYSINPQLKVYFDVLDFVEMLIEGRTKSNKDNFQAWTRATMIYGGPFLQGHQEAWVINRRAALRAAYIELLDNIGQAWRSRGNHEKALAIFRQAINEDDERQDMHLKYIEQLVYLGRRSEAVNHYRQYLNRLTNVYHKTLSPDIEKRYETLIANS